MYFFCPSVIFEIGSIIDGTDSQKRVFSFFVLRALENGCGKVREKEYLFSSYWAYSLYFFTHEAQTEEKRYSFLLFLYACFDEEGCEEKEKRRIFFCCLLKENVPSSPCRTFFYFYLFDSANSRRRNIFFIVIVCMHILEWCGCEEKRKTRTYPCLGLSGSGARRRG